MYLSNSIMFPKLHAITQKVQLPRSPVEQTNKEQDFAHVLDFLSSIESLEIFGSRDFYKSSNLILNNLRFDLSSFKSLRHLTLSDGNIGSLTCARNLRSTVQTLTIRNCAVKSLLDVLLCDNIHKNVEIKVKSRC